MWGELRNKSYSKRLERIKKKKLGGLVLDAEEELPLELDRVPLNKKGWLVLALCMINLFLVMIANDFSFFINICGSLSSPFIVYVLPGYLYYKMAI